MLISNGVEQIDASVAEQMVNRGFGYLYEDHCYIEIPFWGVLRFFFSKTTNTWKTEGYVPWVGF